MILNDTTRQKILYVRSNHPLQIFNLLNYCGTNFLFGMVLCLMTLSLYVLFDTILPYYYIKKAHETSILFIH